MAMGYLTTRKQHFLISGSGLDIPTDLATNTRIEFNLPRIVYNS